MTRALLLPGSPVTVLTDGDCANVTRSGPAGFFVTGHAAMLYWENRGVTWSSEELDRADKERRNREGAVLKNSEGAQIPERRK
jgi:hypothetical protein